MKLMTLVNKINPEWGTNTLEAFKVIFMPFLVMTIVFCIISCLFKKQWFNVLMTVIAGALTFAILGDTEILVRLSDFLISVLETLGDDIVV